MKTTDWLGYAQTHLRSAELLAAGQQYGDAAFLAHQAAECALKGVVMKMSGEMPPRIHGLRKLAVLVGYPHPNEIGRLEPMYTGPRYPGAQKFVVSASAASESLAIARRVVTWSTFQTS